MGERKSIRLETKQLQALDSMREQGEADDRSEALRTALNIGLAELGYLNGKHENTDFRVACRRLADRLETKQLGALDEMEAQGDADNKSEALRTALNVGLSELGYWTGRDQETRLRVVCRRFADAFALLGLMWVGVSIWLPLELRVWAVGPFSAAFACLVLDRALAAHEPAVSRRLAAVFPGGERA